MAAPAGLANAWQREPWWTNNQEAPFEPPMDLDEIAGLATYADVESLLIATSHANGRTEYRIQHGPFTPSTLASLGDRDWTLLVRDIDRHLPELTGLWQQFDWLADYRRADIMVSVAAPGGSVGPHSDSYDVFLVQGHGRRIWQLAPGDTAEVVPDHPLRLAYPAHFEQEIVADPGATLYVPPGYIHHGVAQTLCTTWSFGLQAPLLADLAAVAGIDIPSSEGQRLADQKLPVRERSGEIPNDAIRTLRYPADSQSDVLDALGILLSSPKPGFELSESEKARHRVSLHPWTRLFWRAEDGASVAYCNGQVLFGHSARASLLERIVRDRCFDTQQDPDLADWLSGCAALTKDFT